MSKKIVIVGGGAAGCTSAQFAKKTDKKAEISIFEKGKYSLYSKCALPYLISDKVKDVVEFSEEWFERNGINLYLETEVKEIDIKSKKIIAERKGEILEKKFDSLVIATGAKPSIPPTDGLYWLDSLKQGIFTLRTLDDAIGIKNYLEKAEDVTIVGAGLIGLELSESFREKNKKVRIIEMLPSILPGMLDPEMAHIVHQKIKHEVEILTKCKVKEIKGSDRVEGIVVEEEGGGEREFETDMVVLATGIKPETELARKIGCNIGKTGGIIVNKKSMTSIKNVYAAGDCTQYRDFVTGKDILVGLGSIGVRQGIVSGINSAGGNAELPDGFLQTRTTKIFGIEISAVGPLSRDIENPISSRYTGKTLPHYFPEGKEIVIKVTLDKDGRIISAQSIGEGSSLRINTFACSIFARMSAKDLSKLETAYAPSVAPTLDPMIVAVDMVRYKYERR